jgi:hypothetical protein
MNENSLASEISTWFNLTESNKNRWQSPVGKIIKERLKKLGNWKEKARWHPPKSAINDNIRKHETKEWEQTTDENW